MSVAAAAAMPLTCDVGEVISLAVAIDRKSVDLHCWKLSPNVNANKNGPRICNVNKNTVIFMTFCIVKMILVSLLKINLE